MYRKVIDDSVLPTPPEPSGEGGEPCGSAGGREEARRESTSQPPACRGPQEEDCRESGEVWPSGEEGSWTGGHVSHRDPGAVSGVGDADLQLLRSPAHLPCIGQGLAGELLADPGGRGSPGLELEIRGETAQGEQLYRKEIYLFI